MKLIDKDALSCDSKFGLYSKDNYCQACGAIMENNGDDDDE